MNPSPTELSPDSLTVTVLAREKITQLLADADDGLSAVRVFVSGGGCGGMNYGMTFAESVGSKDRKMSDESGFALVIDPIAYSYIHGAEIYYKDDGVSASFVFNNVFQSVGGSGACGGCGGAY